MNTNPKTYLQELSCEVQYKVKHKLNTGNAWKSVAEYCHIGDEYGLHAASNHGEALVNELCAQNYTIGELCEALAKCDLCHILALFQEPAPLEIEAQPLILSKRKLSHNAHGTCNGIFIEEGRELKLKAQATGIPPPKFEWYCENSLICSNSSGFLTIEKFEKKDEGRYWCKISQKQENSQVPVSKMTDDLLVALRVKVPEISAKKALLIANENYRFDALKAPASDTAKLQEVLEKNYNFEVTVAKDLTGEQMRNKVKSFWHHIPESAYVVFYFAGHGFHVNNKIFFMGVDKVEAQDFRYEHAMSAEEVLCEGSTHKPRLLLMLGDTCQSKLESKDYVAISEQSPPKYDYDPYPDIIQGYATSINGSALETDDGHDEPPQHRGVFTDCLIKALHTHTHCCVSQVLQKVREGVNKELKDDKAAKQVPIEITSATQPHRLSNPIAKQKKSEGGGLRKNTAKNSTAEQP